MSEDEKRPVSLTSLVIQVDAENHVHSFANNGTRWIFGTPIPLVDLLQTYTPLVTDPGNGLTPLIIQADATGHVHAYTDDQDRWIFRNPITILDLLQTYKDVIANLTLASPPPSIPRAPVSQRIPLTDREVAQRR